MQGARDGLSVRLSASTPVPSNPVSLLPRSVPAPWWVLLLFWALVLLSVVLSLLPVEQLPREVQFWDKAQHALGFAGLAFLGVLAYARWPLRVLAGLALLGLCIEVAQSLTGWRHGDGWDWLADLVGLLMGWQALLLWRWLAARVRARRA